MIVIKTDKVIFVFTSLETESLKDPFEDSGSEYIPDESSSEASEPESTNFLRSFNDVIQGKF